MDKIKVLSIEENTENIRHKNLYKKELVRKITMTVYDKDTDGMKVMAVASFFMGRSSSASVVYADFHFSSKNVFNHATGSAGGGGYDKESAALAEALVRAGIELDQRIAGRGEYAMYEALKGIARFYGVEDKHILING